MTRRAVTALAGLLVLSAGGCADTTSRTSPPSSSVQPGYPTAWMQQATVDWDRDRAFRSLTSGGRAWSGDPRRYERACGVTFLIHGTTPALYGGIHGEQPASNPDPTYYHWLQADPERWSAFNAWLYDPAIVATLGHTPDTSLGKTRADRIGTTKDCPDAAAAGTPVR